MGEVKGQGHMVHPVSNRCTSFLFHINQTNHSRDMSNRVFDLEKNTSEENLTKKEFPTSNQVIIMTRGIWSLSFVVISRVVLTLSCRQANFCLSMSQPWPWAKVIKRSSSTFSQTYTFFVLNILGLAQTVLTWEAKVIAAAAAADTDADAAAETNWKHKFPPDWGDLIIRYVVNQFFATMSARSDVMQ